MTSSSIRKKSSRRTSTITGMLLGGLAAAVALAGCSAGTGTDAAQASELPATQVRKDLNAMVENGVPGGIIYIRDGKQTFSAAAGDAELKPQRRMKVGLRYRIASETKSMVSTVVFQLAEEDKLELSGNVEDWFPGLVQNGSEITLRDLLTHQSGIPDFLASDRPIAPYLAGHFNHVWTPKQLIGFGTDLGTNFTPGKHVAYSNTNYTILGLIIQKATGNSLGAELKSRIFRPLGMNRSSFPASPNISGSHANGYLIQKGQDPMDVTGISPSYYWGAGSVISTVTDMADFYDALLEGDLLSPASLAEMKRGGPSRKGVGFGAGLFHGKLECGEFFGHDGAVPGYFSTALKMEDGRTVVAMANSLTFSDDVGSPKATAAWERLIEDAACE